MNKGNAVIDRDRGWAQLFKAAREIGKGSYAKVGILADTEQGGLHEEGGNLTVGEIAVVQEFGTEDGSVPAHSFVRRTFDEQTEKLKQISEKLVVQIMLGRQKVRGALGIMGLYLANAIKQRVTQGDPIPPPNAPATVEAKGSDRPLVDTSRMINATTHVVVDRGGEG